MVAAAIIGAGVIGAGASLAGSSMAAGSAEDAAKLQDRRYQQTRSDLFPYVQPGYNALSDAYALARLGPTGGGPDYVSMAAANLPGRMTQAELEATPGYQFDRDQGLKAVQSAAAARGLGVSGASLKGAGTFATGLANKTYLDQFNVAQQRFGDITGLNAAQQGNITNNYNRLMGISTLGENAAAQTGVQGTALANAAGNYINQAGLANAAGLQGVNNALTGAANSYAGYQNYKDLINRVGTTGYPSGNVSGFQNNSDLLSGATTVGGNTWYGR